MVKLNLEASGQEQEKILNYLQENASETLASKINNGTLCNLLVTKQRNLQKRMLGTLACPTILFTAGLFTTSKKKV